MIDPDLKAFQDFYTRVIGVPDGEVYRALAKQMLDPTEAFVHDTDGDAKRIHDFFEEDRKKYYLEELTNARQEEARVCIYLSSLTGEEWPEDFIRE